jgi:5-(carboxyamino)imidazole ribonucleotide mutase
MLAVEFPMIGEALAAFRSRQTEDVVGNDDPRR